MAAGIPSTMKAAEVVEYNKPYEIHSVATPKDVGPNDLLLKVAVASYCHTDGMVVKGSFGTQLPCVASHEGTGTVVALGSDVHDFKHGDRVMAGLPRDRCQHCSDCLGPEGYRQYCPNISGHVGVTMNGAFAEYMAVDARESSVLPDNLSFETAAPLACAGVTVYRALLQTGLTKGETVGLVGAGGGLGHLGCQFAKAMGLVLVGLDARDEGLNLARKSGADVVIDARKVKSEVVQEVQKVTNGQGVDSTVNLSDHESAAGLAAAITKMHGTVIQIAQPPMVSIPFQEFIFRDIRFKGSLVSTKQEAQQMLKLVAERKISVTTNPFFGLDQIPKLVEYVESGKMSGKALVVVDEVEQQRVKNKQLEEV